MISYKAIFCSTLQKMLWNNYVQLRFQQTTKIVVYKWPKLLSINGIYMASSELANLFIFRLNKK